MKKSKTFTKIYAILMIITVLMGVFTLTPSFATENLISIDRITYLDNDNKEVDYPINSLQKQLEYKRGIKIYYSVSTPKFSIEILINNGSGYVTLDKLDPMSADKNIVDMTSYSGDIKVIATALTANGLPQGSINAFIFSDNTAPLAEVTPNTITDWVNQPFNAEVKIAKDIHSGINFEKSYYYYKDIFDNKVVDDTKIDKLDFSITINTAGTLTIYMVDNAHNSSLLDCQYIKFGTPETAAPTITVSPESGWTTKVTVDISWGEDIDNSPSFARYYEIKTSSGSLGKRRYTAPFDVAQEGKIIIHAFYYNGGSEKCIDKIINNVDKTKPFYSTVKETIRLVVDLRSGVPANVEFRAIDIPSGVKDVKFANTTQLFSSFKKDYYRANIMDKANLDIVITDCAGNFISFQYPSNLEYAIIKKYNSLYINLDTALYSQSAIARIESLYDQLNILLMSDSPSYNDINLLTTKLDKEIVGEVENKFKIIDIPQYSNGNITYSLEKDTLPNYIKRGESVTLTLDLLQLDSVEQIYKDASASVGFANSFAYGFNLKLMYNDKNIISELSAPLTITLNLMSTYSKRNARILQVIDGIPVPLNIACHNGKFVLSTNTLGDYIIVIEGSTEADKFVKETAKGIRIGNRIYSYPLVFGVSFGILAVAGIAIFVIYKKTKSR